MIELHVFFHNAEQDERLREILTIVKDLQKREIKMAASIEALTAQVQANTDVEASAVTLIQGIAQQLAAAQGDPQAVAALISKLNNSAASLAAAITANTPAAG